ncbi:hypothetical protein AKJ51_04845, partial [candidate division MSBL1 archaeon SCGC-AAA382A20]
FITPGRSPLECGAKWNGAPLSNGHKGDLPQRTQRAQRKAKEKKGNFAQSHKDTKENKTTKNRYNRLEKELLSHLPDPLSARFISTQNSKLKTQNCRFTLIEILIAVAILAVATMGIFSIFPYSIRNVSLAVNKTVSGSVARTAVVSLRQYRLDLSRLNSWTQGDLQAQKKLVDFLNGQSLTETNGYKIPEEIPENGPPNAAKTVPYGIQQTSGNWQDTRHSWSATFIPASGGGYRMQVADWHKYKLIASSSDLSLDFKADGSVTVSGFWDGIDAGDYVRNYDQGLWYKIESVDEASSSLQLYASPVGTPPGPAEAADDRNLVAVYDTAIR